MSQHKLLSADLDMSVYFCDPHSPWQKGAIENINGLIRQFLPKGSGLSDVSQDELDETSHLLKHQTKKSIGFPNPKRGLHERI